MSEVLDYIKQIFAGQDDDEEMIEGVEVFALRVDFKEFVKKYRDFRWFIRRTNCMGHLTEKDDSYVYLVYNTKEAAYSALKIAQNRYDTVIFDEEHDVIEEDFLYKMLENERKARAMEDSN